MDTNNADPLASFSGNTNEFWGRLLENVTDAVIVIDENHRVVSFNRGAEAIFGHLYHEVINQPLNILIPDRFVAVHSSHIDRFLDSHETSRYIGGRQEISGLRKGGTEFPAEATITKLFVKGTVYYIAILRDLTELKQAEREREELISELEAFAHTVAHDLKEPLSIISGYSRLALETFSESSDEEFRAMLNSIDNCAVKMAQIIDELLLFASTRQSNDVKKTPLEMISLAKDAIARLDTLIEEHQAEIVFLDSDAWPVAVGYAPWIEEVWANYVSNAIKYGGEAPHIELGAKRQKDGLICFWVRDNGTGLTPEKQAQLFRPFTRLGDIRIQGHGFGLSIVQRIINRLGGEVRAESAVGQGSTFSFTLPANATVLSHTKVQGG